MNDRPEFLDRLKTDLAAGVPGFRGRQRRRRIAASAVAGVALLGGLGAFVAFGDDGEPTDSVSAVGETELPESSGPAEEVEPLTGTVRDLTDTVGDIEDLTLEVGVPPDLVAVGQTPGGEAEACPLTATSQSGETGLAEGEFQEVDEGDDLIAFIGQHISDTYPEGAPIRTSSLYLVTDPDDRRATVAVLARWRSDNDTLIGAWFGVAKTAEFGLQISSDWGCTPFLWGDEDLAEPTAPPEAAPAVVWDLDELLAGLRGGLTEYDVAQTPAELRTSVDISVRGTVVAVHEGRTFRDLLSPSGLNNEVFATLEIEGEEFAPGSGTRRSTFYFEIEVGNLGVEELRVLFRARSELLAFGIDTSDVDLGEQWAIDNPLGGRPDANTPIFTVHPQGLLLVTDQSLVSVYDDLALGWTPALNFATGTEAADWVVAEATK